MLVTVLLQIANESKVVFTTCPSAKPRPFYNCTSFSCLTNFVSIDSYSTLKTKSVWDSFKKMLSGRSDQQQTLQEGIRPHESQNKYCWQF